ncbi:hypothetical protein GWI33_016169 [Rhynchophorus ferrugineus]|uniref:Uncharacterized protein n=1 Tax=Rhynchophorus ferrugineus TaxID=354439 RepID=A0A834I3Y9_RHYFE|nr:hypothetical protein GWI33_016169 [Rhynchophorus ferrugineus]
MQQATDRSVRVGVDDRLLNKRAQHHDATSQTCQLPDMGTTIKGNNVKKVDGIYSFVTWVPLFVTSNYLGFINTWRWVLEEKRK